MLMYLSKIVLHVNDYGIFALNMLKHMSMIALYYHVIHHLLLAWYTAKIAVSFVNGFQGLFFK